MVMRGSFRFCETVFIVCVWSEIVIFMERIVAYGVFYYVIRNIFAENEKFK